MLPVLHLLANAIAFASCLVSRQHLVYSNASLALTLSSASRNLAGLTSSSHSLQFLLKNNANPRQLVVSQESMEGVTGRLMPTSVNLTRGYFTTLRSALNSGKTLLEYVDLTILIIAFQQKSSSLSLLHYQFLWLSF